MTPNDFSNLAAATAAPTTSRLRRRNHTGGPSGFDRKAFIAQLTQADGGLEDILAKRPTDLTEAEIRKIAERRLSLPAGTEKDALFRIEQAFYDGVYGDDAAETDGTGRLVQPTAKRPVKTQPVPARTADGMELDRAVASLAKRVADVAETEGARSAVRFLQNGLSMISQAHTASRDTAPESARDTAPLFADLKDDGDAGPKTRGAMRTMAARLGTPKVEEALALGRFEAALRDLTQGSGETALDKTASDAFADLFRDPKAARPIPRTEEGESLQMSVNDLGRALLGDQDFPLIREDGVVGPKTEAAFKRVLAAAGPRRVAEAMGRNLGVFMFEAPGRRANPRSLLQSPASPAPMNPNAGGM